MWIDRQLWCVAYKDKDIHEQLDKRTHIYICIHHVHIYTSNVGAKVMMSNVLAAFIMKRIRRRWKWYELYYRRTHSCFPVDFHTFQSVHSPSQTHVTHNSVWNNCRCDCVMQSVAVFVATILLLKAFIALLLLLLLLLLYGNIALQWHNSEQRTYQQFPSFTL